jgi:hypothetical protein
MTFVLADRLDDVLATAMPEEFHLNRSRQVERIEESGEPLAARDLVGALG